MSRNAQSLDWSASSSRAARSIAGPRPACAAAATVASSAPRAAKATSATRGESHVVRSFGDPQVEAASSRFDRLDALEPVRERRQLEPGRVRLLEHGREPRGPLVPPVAEQLGVERAAEEARAAALARVGVEPRDHLRDEVARVLARQRRRARSWSYGSPPIVHGLRSCSVRPW